MTATQSPAETKTQQPSTGRADAGYWRVRIQSTLERLERESRRMLQLEEDLSLFSQQYYEAVGEVTERLARVEEKIAETTPTHEISISMPAVLASRETVQARQKELKSRYRTLAKEIHPDRSMSIEGTGETAEAMQSLNNAYQHGDLAAMLKLEAHLAITRLGESDFEDMGTIEQALREVERAADTYASGYRELLASPLNELMLRAMSAKLAGWDWMQAVVKKVEREIEEKERAAAMQSIAQISAWRESVTTV